MKLERRQSSNALTSIRYLACLTGINFWVVTAMAFNALHDIIMFHLLNNHLCFNMQQHLDYWHFELRIKKQQECGCSKREDKPGAKDHYSTDSALINKVTVPQYLNRHRRGAVQCLFREFSHKEQEMAKKGTEDKATDNVGLRFSQEN